MSTTVPSRVNGSFPSQADEALRRAQMGPSRRHWTFINRLDGSLITEVCPSWCTRDHSCDMETPSFPEDIYHRGDAVEMWVSVNVSPGRTEERRVLGSNLSLHPYSDKPAERVPHVDVELMDDEYIEALNPDGLMDLINDLRIQVGRMVERHAQLVQARAEWNGETA